MQIVKSMKIVATCQAAEKLLAEGRARAIGVSNFSGKHLENLVGRTEVHGRTLRGTHTCRPKHLARSKPYKERTST